MNERTNEQEKNDKAAIVKDLLCLNEFGDFNCKANKNKIPCNIELPN